MDKRVHLIVGGRRVEAGASKGLCASVTTRNPRFQGAAHRLVGSCSGRGRVRAGFVSHAQTPGETRVWFGGGV